MKPAWYFFIFFSVGSCHVYGQEPAQLEGLIKKFAAILAFQEQENVYYTTETRTVETPFDPDKDSIPREGIFYKNGHCMYAGTGMDELFIEDSLTVQINHGTTTIWIDKLGKKDKEPMNGLSLTSKEITRMIAKGFTGTISTSPDGSAVIHLATRPPDFSGAGTSTAIALEYWESTGLPKSITVNIVRQQLADSLTVQAIKMEGRPYGELIKEIRGVEYLVTSHQIKVRFTKIEINQQSGRDIPTYRDKVIYNPATRKFSGVGIYSDYEITIAH
jgi:hypothetical protein